MKKKIEINWLGEHKLLAVDWLWKQLEDKDISTVNELEELFIKAKKMQEDQMWKYALYVVKEWQEQKPPLRFL